MTKPKRLKEHADTETDPSSRSTAPLPTITQLFEQAGSAQQWWGMIAAFLVDEYRARTAVRWLPAAQAWEQTYLMGPVILVHVVPQAGGVTAFVPLNASAVKRARVNPSILDGQARLAFDTYLIENSTMPAVRLASEDDTDAVVRLVSIAHPRKGHPCGSL